MTKDFEVMFDTELTPWTPEAYRKTGFTENHQAALGITIMEDLPITSRNFVGDQGEDEIERQLLAKKDLIPPEVWSNYDSGGGELDILGLADYAHYELGFTDIPVGADYEKMRNEEYAQFRNYTQSITDKQNAFGMVGQFAGVAHGMMLDPLYALSLISGYGATAGAVKLGIMTAGIEGGLEVVAQPFVKNYKDSIGAKHTGVDMLINVVGSGLAAGLLAGGVKAVSNVLVGDVSKALKGADDDLTAGVKNTLDKSDPEANAKQVLEADENKQNEINFNKSREGADPRGSEDLSPEELATQRGEWYANRMGQVEEAQVKLRDEQLTLETQARALDEEIEARLGPLKDEIDSIDEAIQVRLKDAPSPERDMDLQLLRDAQDAARRAVTAQAGPEMRQAASELRETVANIRADYPDAEMPPAVTRAVDNLEQVDEAVAKQEVQAQEGAQRMQEAADEVSAADYPDEVRLDVEDHNQIEEMSRIIDEVIQENC